LHIYRSLKTGIFRRYGIKITEGMIKVSLVELEQAGLELKGLEKDIRELGDSL